MSLRTPENATLICERSIEIYALVDPRDEVVRYIGKATDAAARLRTHLRDAPRRKTPVYKWIKELRGLGLIPAITVLRIVPEDQWCDAEREEISRRPGLLNVAPGGNQPVGNAETSRANALRLVALRESDPKRKRLQYLRMQITRGLKAGYVRSDKSKAALRRLIARWPEQYGQWASILDEQRTRTGR